MSDRDVQVIITLKAYQVETLREWFARAKEFTDAAGGYALEIKKLLSKEASRGNWPGWFGDCTMMRSA